MPDIQGAQDSRGVDIDEVGIGALRYPVTFDDGDLTQSGIANVEMTVALPADRRGTHMSRMVQAVESELAVVNPYELHGPFKVIAELLDATQLFVTLSLPVAIRVQSPVTANSGYQVQDVSLSGSLVGSRFILATMVTVDVTTLCPCSKAISDYGAHNQRSRVSLSIKGEGDTPYPATVGDLVSLIRDSSSCPVYPVVKRPDERAITMAAYDNPKFVEDLIRDLSISVRQLGLAHQIEARNIESIHSHDAVARLSWSGD
ncbi:GTP cyclohydrolase [Mycobacterium sp. CBMA 234]|nr:GTP cyclohydrolase [Mycolicibacterium sp. CBMA 234]